MKDSIQRVLLSTLDAQLPAIAAAQKSVSQPAGGWLRAVRQSLGLAQATVAKRARISQQTYAQFEQGEAKATLSLGNLQRAAEAMNCDLVYYLVPRAKSFGELAMQLDPNFAHLQASEHSMALEGQAVGDLPRKLEGPSPDGPGI